LQPLRKKAFKVELFPELLDKRIDNVLNVSQLKNTAAKRLFSTPSNMIQKHLLNDQKFHLINLMTLSSYLTDQRVLMTLMTLTMYNQVSH